MPDVSQTDIQTENREVKPIEINGLTYISNDFLKSRLEKQRRQSKKSKMLLNHSGCTIERYIDREQKTQKD